MHDQTWHTTRALAEREYCAECHSPPGTTCTRKGADGRRHPIENFPAHSPRIRKATKAQEKP